MKFKFPKTKEIMRYPTICREKEAKETSDAYNRFQHFV